MAVKGVEPQSLDEDFAAADRAVRIWAVHRRLFPYGVQNLQRLHMRRDIVNPQDRRAVHDAHEARRDGAGDALGGRLLAGHDPDGRLARHAEQHRTAERRKLPQAPDQLEILRRRLAEAEARIDQQPLLGDAGGQSDVDRARQEIADVGDDVQGGIDGRAIVHQHRRRAAVGDDAGHFAIPLKSPDVVDHRSACGDGGGGDARFAGVDGNRQGDAALQRGDDGNDAGHFLVRRHRARRRAGSTRRRRPESPRPRRRAARHGGRRLRASQRRRRRKTNPASR